ncbi:MAG: hypothetical protein ACLQAT_30165 [Candidatus Binataceae bacterium]
MNDDSLSEFNSSGTPISPSTGYTGGGLSDFACPDAIAIDASDNVWVTNECSNSLSEFNSSGTRYLALDRLYRRRRDRAVYHYHRRFRQRLGGELIPQYLERVQLLWHCYIALYRLQLFRVQERPHRRFGQRLERGP